jgi:hypothetical protein
MNKKTIIYILGGVAILGIGFYMLNKNKKTVEQKESLDETKDTTSVLPVSPIAPAPAPAPATTPAPVVNANSIFLTKQPKVNTATATAGVSNIPKVMLTDAELELQLQNACGNKRPAFKGGKRDLYDKCRSNFRDNLRAKGLVSFDGSYSNNRSVNGTGFFSNFDNGLNLDL